MLKAWKYCERRLQDKIHSFWDISKQEVEQLQAALRRKDRDAEEAEDKHQVEVKVCKSRLQTGPLSC